MKRRSTLWILVAALLVVAAHPAFAAKAQKVKGEVIQVEQQVQAAGGGTYDRLTLQTRQGERIQLHLGEGGACAGCFQVGDRVRARVMDQDRDGSGAYGVQSMRLRRAGETFGFHNDGGRMVPGAQRGRGDAGLRGGGAGDRDRQQIHTPGTGGGTGRGVRGGGGGRG